MEKYPELNQIAHNLTLEIIKDISLQTRDVNYEIDCKFKYVLERVIKNLSVSV